MSYLKAGMYKGSKLLLLYLLLVKCQVVGVREVLIDSDSDGGSDVMVSIDGDDDGDDVVMVMVMVLKLTLL